MTEEDRFWVNLTTDSFMDFKLRGQLYEVRAYGRQGFTEEKVYAGKRAELRNAFSRGSLWGTVGEVLVGSIEDIFDSVGDYRLIEPKAKSRKKAISANRKLLKNPKRYIVFEVLLDSTE